MIRIVVWAAIAVAMLSVAVFLTPPAHAQQCISIHQAQGLMKASHLTVVGVLPFHEGRALYYREGKHLFAAPIDGGCVSPGGVPVQRPVDDAEPPRLSGRTPLGVFA